MWLNLYGRQAVQRKPKKAQNCLFGGFLALFRAYVRQSDDHIGWVTLLPFASINPTKLLGVVEKLSFFESAILIFFSKEFFFCFILIQIHHESMGTKDGMKFWWLPFM